jgi:exosome complex RNA-binding protein Csl4
LGEIQRGGQAAFRSGQSNIGEPSSSDDDANNAASSSSSSSIRDRQRRRMRSEEERTAANARDGSDTDKKEVHQLSIGDHVKALVISVDVHSEKIYLSLNNGRLTGLTTRHSLGVCNAPRKRAAPKVYVHTHTRLGCLSIILCYDV